MPFPGGNYCIQQRVQLILGRLSADRSGLFICAGDLVDVGSSESYPALDYIFRDLKLSERVAFTPGNHDRTLELITEVGMVQPTERAQISARQNYTLVRDVHHILFLDSSPHQNFPGARGEVGAEGREWLKGTLQEIPKGHVAWIVTHYPTIPFSANLPEKATMVDGLEVHDLLTQFRTQIGAVIYGHVHHRYQHVKDNIAYLSVAPSSVPLICKTPGRGEFDENGAIGFETLVLHPDATFSRTMHDVDVGATAIDAGTG